MDTSTYILSQLKNEGMIIGLVLTAAVLIYYIKKLWSSPEDAALGMILGATLALACGVVYFTHTGNLLLHKRLFWFVVLYVWCVLGMLFFAARDTHRVKLLLGLASQAGILYALFVFL